MTDIDKREPRLSTIVVLAPFDRGSKVAWQAEDGSLVHGGVLVEVSLLSVAVYLNQRIFLFSLRADGRYRMLDVQDDSPYYALCKVAVMR